MTTIRATFLLLIHLLVVDSFFFQSANDTKPLRATTQSAGLLEGTDTNIVNINVAEKDTVLVVSGLEVGIVFIVLICVLLLVLGGFLYVRRKRTRKVGYARVKLNLLAKQNAGVYQETTSSENILFLIPPKQIPDKYSSVLEYSDLYESDSSDAI